MMMIMITYKVCQQQYADDTQLYVVLSPVNYNDDISALQSCLTSLQAWFCESGMALNPSMSVAILFGTTQRLKSVSDKCITVANTAIRLSDKVKILGVTLDSNLTMGPHTKALSKSCFYHIRSFRQIRSSLDNATAASVASAFVSSHLDQMNSVLYGTGTALKHTGRLQRVQHALARVMVNQHSRTPFSSNELLKQLHWLPLEWCIQFKLATLTFKALHTDRLPFLPTSCNTISPQGLYAHPLLISYLFRDITYHLDLVLSASQPHGSGTNSLSAFAKPSHFLLLNAILRLTFSSQLTPPPSDPPSNAP